MKKARDVFLGCRTSTKYLSVRDDGWLRIVGCNKQHCLVWLCNTCVSVLFKVWEKSRWASWCEFCHRPMRDGENSQTKPVDSKLLYLLRGLSALSSHQHSWQLDGKLETPQIICFAEPFKHHSSSQNSVSGLNKTCSYLQLEHIVWLNGFNVLLNTLTNKVVSPYEIFSVFLNIRLVNFSYCERRIHNQFMYLAFIIVSMLIL
jgi:hypothetical protein